MKTIKKLLVIRLSALGDVCMTLPVIDSFCRKYPDVDVTFLTSKPGAAITNAVLNHQNLTVLPINKKDYSGILGINRLFREMKSKGFDGIADLHDVLRTKWLDFRYRLAGLPVAVIDKGRDEKKMLVGHRMDAQLMSGVDRYLEVFKKLGYDFVVDYDGTVHRSQANALPLAIGIAPFAQHQGKIYPTEQMYQVIGLLTQAKPDIHIYLFGGPEDSAILQKWADEYPAQVENVAGKQTFAEDLRLMSRLRLMVSMDSANMHLASLVGLRCISVWGATHRFAGFLGYGQKEDDCVELPLPCRPCSIYGNKPCKFADYRCLKQIQPEVLADKIIQSL